MGQPPRDFDVIVAGLGAFGSAATFAAARRGLRVLGLDRFDPPHSLGSSHGRTRIIREAYFEAPFYVPLVRKAFRLWRELESRGARELLRVTGGLAVGPPDGGLIGGTLASAQEHGLEHELLDAGELARRFPALAFDDSDSVGVFEARAGVLMAEACVEALLEAAREEGAALRSREGLDEWEVRGEEVIVRTERRTYRAEHLVLALGPWLGRHLRGRAGAFQLEVERQVVQWFAPPRGPGTALPHEPVTIWEYRPGGIFYTIPDVGDGLKAALHHEGEATDPDRDPRTVTSRDGEEAQRLVSRLLPRTAGPLLRSSVCLYTNSGDGNPLIGPDPEEGRVILAGAGSGHGFKFAPVVGELALAHALGERSDLPAELLPARFGSAGLPSTPKGTA